MKTFFTLLFFISFFGAYSQSVLTYREVYDFQPGEVFGRYLSVTVPVPNPDPFGPNFSRLDKRRVTDSILSRNLFSGGDSVRYQIHRTTVFGIQVTGVGFTDTLTVLSTEMAEYNFRDIPIVNTLPPPVGPSSYMDTAYKVIGDAYPGFRFERYKNPVVDSTLAYFKGIGGPFIWSNVSQMTFWEDFTVIKKNGMAALANPAIMVLLTSNQPLESKNETISLWPNPAQSELNIANLLSDVSINVFDATGKEILSIDKWNGRQLDVKSLKPGLYFIYSTDQNKVIATKRFVKN